MMDGGRRKREGRKEARKEGRKERKKWVGDEGKMKEF